MPALSSAARRVGIGFGAGGDENGNVVRRCDQLRGQRQPRLAVEHDANRRARRQARQPDAEQRIVGERRADADQDRVGSCAHQMHLPPGDLAGDRDLSLALAADHAVS